MAKGKQRKTKFYHASPRRIKVGETISAHKYPVFDDYPCWCGVFITTEPLPHFTLLGVLLKNDDPWHVYEVIPNGKVWTGEWNDLVCESAEVVKYIGNAKGILKHKDKKYRPSSTKYRVGSYVDFRIVDYPVKGRGKFGGAKTIYPQGWSRWNW